MKLNRKWIMTIALVLSMTMAVSGTLAYLTDHETKTNTFTMGNVDIEVIEDFTQNALLKPGQTVTKKAKIVNIGNKDAWVWMTVSVPETLKDYVTLNWTDDYKDKVTGPEVVNDEAVWTVLVEKALKPNEPNNTTGDILESVTLSPLVDYQKVDETFKYVIIQNGEPVALEGIDENKLIVTVTGYATQTDSLNNVTTAYYTYNGQWGNDIAVSGVQELKDAMLSRAGTIVLQDDIVIGADDPLQWGAYMFVANGREVTIDLNGKTVTVAEDAQLKVNGLFTTANGGTLNIVGEGTVEVKNGKSGIFHAMNKNDQINVYGGTYISNSDNGSNALAIIYTNSGNVDVFGGKFIPLDGVTCANAEDRQGERTSIVFHEGTLLKHDKYYEGSDNGRIILEEGCSIQETTVDGETWYKVTKE